MKVYQILVVSRAVGFNFIVPDVYVYKTYSEAFNDIQARKKVFQGQGEDLTFCGKISTIKEIAEIYHEQDIINDTNDAYIYELDVK